ncbi:hypothetical protein DFP94_1108 [Fontibacillus phaseoli]|uniref:DUF2642 domain-containing protein n=1 Tax=Fontibacillus phaseoli TaxID=1416533 RepID=A0A369B8M8_9BACL|nr:hypothetical protein [Fontibacillus phaseoli]RCX16948.1 hypothetical protein DFP94_1108 [Fontibacillus phaseoli]
MNFEERLSAFIGRVIEVVYSNQFIQGRLLRVANEVFVVQAESSNYIPEPREVLIFTENVSFIRIPPR